MDLFDKELVRFNPEVHNKHARPLERNIAYDRYL